MENMKKSLILIYLAIEIAFRPLGYYSPLLLMALHYCQNITHLLFKDKPLAPLKEINLARQIESGNDSSRESLLHCSFEIV